MSRVSAAGLVLAAWLLPAAALADEDSDLNLIPPSLQQPAAPPPVPAAPTAASGAQVYVEDATTLWFNRDSLPVPPPGQGPDWQHRLFLDARGAAALTDTLNVDYSGRLNVQAENDIDNPGSHTVRLDARELYEAWEPAPGTFIDVGRINLKSGVANGDNPTDFFRARAVVEPLSADPSVLREDRLGTVMIEAQHFWTGAALTLAYAPRLAAPAPIRASAAELPAFNPLFDQTNTTDRWLAKVTATLAEDFAPEALLYHAGAETRAGLNLSQSLGRATVLYAEWSGGPQADLPAEAFSFARASGMLPEQAPDLLPSDPHRSFQNELALGGSYSTETKLSFIAEYDYHQAGLTGRQWREWYAIGTAPGATAQTRAELWLIPAYAGDQQESLGQHHLFLRASWNDAFVRDLELDAFGIVSLQDGSVLTQVSATYDLSDHWRLGALATWGFGGRRTEYGGQTPAGSLIAKVARYF
jgi:hypothetical protein